MRSTWKEQNQRISGSLRGWSFRVSLKRPTSQVLFQFLVSRITRRGMLAISWFVDKNELAYYLFFQPHLVLFASFLSIWRFIYTSCLLEFAPLGHLIIELQLGQVRRVRGLTYAKPTYRYVQPTPKPNPRPCWTTSSPWANQVPMRY